MFTAVSLRSAGLRPRSGNRFASFIEYLPVIHSPVSILELVEGKETAELRWHVRTDLGSNNQANYQAVLLNLKLLRLISGRTFRQAT